jgi:hypothetical protein
LLDDTEDVVDVFCEQHEDVLLKHADGMFTGVQVKTRNSDQEVWRTSDEGLHSALVRFVMLDSTFPGQFREFLFLTNHAFHSGRNGQNPCHVLSEIRRATAFSSLPSSVRKVLSRIAKVAGCSDEAAFPSLRKCSASADLPRRHDIETRLVRVLAAIWAPASDCSHSALVRAAQALAAECGRSSSLAHEGLVPIYLPTGVHGDGADRSAVLAKRLTKERVLKILEDDFRTTAALEGDVSTLVGGPKGSPALLGAKLTAGGFSANSQNSAQDLRNKADYLSLVWTNKHGSAAGLQRQHHIRSLVRYDAADAYEATRRNDAAFGIAMRDDLRIRLRARRQKPGQQLYDCSDEHLEGFAYGLTSECEIAWSTDRPWEKPE